MKRSVDADDRQPPSDPRLEVRRRVVHDDVVTTTDRILAFLLGHHPRCGCQSPLQDLPKWFLQQTATEVSGAEYVCRFAADMGSHWELRVVSTTGVIVTAATYNYPEPSVSLVEAPSTKSIVYHGSKTEYCVYNSDGSVCFRAPVQGRFRAIDIPLDYRDNYRWVAVTKNHAVFITNEDSCVVLPVGRATPATEQRRVQVAGKLKFPECRWRGTYREKIAMNVLPDDGTYRCYWMLLDPVTGAFEPAPWQWPLLLHDVFNFTMRLHYDESFTGAPTVGYYCDDAYREVRFQWQVPVSMPSARFVGAADASGMFFAHYNLSSSPLDSTGLAVYAPPILPPNEPSPTLSVAATFAPYVEAIGEVLPDVACAFVPSTFSLAFFRRDAVGHVSIATVALRAHKVFGLNAANHVVGVICVNGPDQVLHVVDALTGTVVAHQVLRGVYCTPILTDLLL